MVGWQEFMYCIEFPSGLKKENYNYCNIMIAIMTEESALAAVMGTYGSVQYWDLAWIGTSRD
jgi:hypothetical protein